MRAWVRFDWQSWGLFVSLDWEWQNLWVQVGPMEIEIEWGKWKE